MFAIALVSLLSASAVAQYGGPPPSATTAPVSVPSAPPDSPGLMNVDVAFQGSFTFHPTNLSAPNGTNVVFWFPFIPGIDHSVTQSSFEEPCTYLNSTGNSSAGFDSGLQHAVTFNITIEDDSKPIWFHCKQVGHCGMGMVGSINAPSTGNLSYEAFRQAALNIGGSEVTETDHGPVTGGVNGIATAPPPSDTGLSTGSAVLGASCNIPLASFVGGLALMLLIM
ncbi:hypothetical protein E4T56_gene12367 [Termitomyces sp. T112]|nr:hypothetical protein E4T56_gene12367 [Termitomyces sp. T112]KAH0584234.1 hypothetical protein H2248_009786 [Termitomyces sp. 'cryptogamus']